MKKLDKSPKDNIIEVYEDNFIEEIKRVNSYLEEYNYIGMDTEFPGTVYGINNITPDFYYKEIKLNVDSLKLIQLGITLCNEKGEYPKDIRAWQFNLKFDYEKDKYAQASYQMLINCGIDFDKLKKKGIDHKLFSEYFTISGLVLNPDVHWISFHGSYDFAYMLKLLINKELPDTSEKFTSELITYFPNHYDIRILVLGKENLKGGLNRLAQYLEVLRVGKTHQAGSDSIVTADVFFKLLENNMIDKENIRMDKNILFGIGEGADDTETMQYIKLNSTSNLNNMNSLNTSSSSGNMLSNSSSYGYMPITNPGLNSTLNSNSLGAGKNSMPMNTIYPSYFGQNFSFPYGNMMNNNSNSNGKNKNNMSMGYHN
ncbi:MAG: hypothetical protein MJ252_30660 [archaeon]|nr:hypothetical protein [archaeon]